MSNVYLDELTKQKNLLADALTNAGVEASHSEKFNTLVPKVNNINQAKLEEKTVENISSISTTNQLMQLNYPDNTDKTISANVSSINFVDGTLWSTPVTQKGVTVQYLADEDCFLFNGTSTSGGNLATKQVNIPGTHTVSLMYEYVSGTIQIPTNEYAVMYLDSADKPNLASTTNFANNNTNNKLNKGYVYGYSNITQIRFFLSTGVVFTNYKVKLAASTVKTLTEYIPHKYSVKLTASGKNLIHYPYTNTSYTHNGITYTVNDDGTITANGTIQAKTLSYIYITGTFELPLSYNYVISGSPIIDNIRTTVMYANAIGATSLDGASSVNGSITLFYRQTKVNTQQILLSMSNSTESAVTITNAVFKPMIQFLGDSTEAPTTVEYEKGSAITYTPNANGNVTNIPAHSPKTILYTNVTDKNATLSITSGAYKEILPSTDKNGINPLWQEIIGSNIDDNIKPEHIRKGYTILGVTGTME